MSFIITMAHNTTSTVHAPAQTQQAYYFTEQEAKQIISLNELRCMNICMHACPYVLCIYMYMYVCNTYRTSFSL